MSQALEAPARLRPAPRVRRLALGGRTALFCERRQQLFELNPTADAIWRGETAGVPADYVAAAVDAWLDAGLVLPEAVAARAQWRPDLELPLQIGGLAATLAVHGADPGVEAVFGQFRARPAPGALRLSLAAEAGRWFLLRDGEPLGRFAAERIVPEVKAVLTEALTGTVRGGAFLLHAALLARDGRGLLLSGAPGAGKTTLTLALARRGFGYGGDDIVRVSAAGELAGVPFCPAVKAGGWALAGGLDGVATHLRGDGQAVRYAPVAGFADGTVDGIGWALTLDRQAGAAARIEPTAPMDMLAVLLAGAFSADHAARGATLAAFGAALAGARCGRLVYDDLDEAAAAVEAMTGV